MLKRFFNFLGLFGLLGFAMYLLATGILPKLLFAWYPVAVLFWVGNMLTMTGLILWLLIGVVVQAITWFIWDLKFRDESVH